MQIFYFDRHTDGIRNGNSENSCPPTVTEKLAAWFRNSFFLVRVSMTTDIRAPSINGEWMDGRCGCDAGVAEEC